MASVAGRRQTVVMLHLALVAGVLGLIAAFGALFWMGTAPLLPAEGADLIAYTLTALAACPILVGLVRARPRIPSRRAEQPVEEFWQDPAAGNRALVLWALWDGGTILGAAGTLLTGSLLPAAAGLVSFALLLTHGPGHLSR